MKNEEIINLVREYLNQHIGENVTAEGLAKVSGYSFYHFCHLFTSVTGQSVAAYIRRRRLELAAEDLLKGSSISIISQRRGYETASGFSKAFRRHYGITPTEYRTTRGGLSMLKPEIKTVSAFTAVGYGLAPPKGEFNVMDTGAYWAGSDFSSVTKEDYARLNAEGLGEIGIWMHPDPVSGEFCYFFGPIVRNADFVPKGMTVLHMPETRYAVFPVQKAATLEGLAENVRRMRKFIYSEWFDYCAYEFNDSRLDFEYYREENSYIYIPIRPKQDPGQNEDPEMRRRQIPAKH